MAWRLAKSLIVLVSELEYLYPDTTVWDIGDKDHQNSWSDHNPNVCCDVVCGVDVLADAGLDLAEFTAHLIANPHPNLRYVIFNRKIYQRKNNFKPETYSGPNAHATHVHVSAGNGPDGRSTYNYDDTSSWDLAFEQLHGGIMLPKYGDKNSSVGYWQGLLDSLGYELTVDDGYGPKVTAAVHNWHAAYLKRHGSNAEPVDGRTITPSVAREIQVDYFTRRLSGVIKGEPGPTGPPGKDGKDGKDGVLKLPASVQITGQVTAIGTGK